MLTKEEINQTLPNFTGTENYYKYLQGMLITDGVKYLAEGAEYFLVVKYISERAAASESAE